ncbi:MAG: primosomal protein N' [Spirochaetales bacterium]|nr:primosomal protein N' [Spirochaetales bacterium]
MNNNEAKIVQVALPIPVSDTFSYTIPNGMDYDDVLFRRVEVEFSGRKLRGYAVAKGQWSDEYEIKPIERVVDKRAVFSEEMVSLAKWLSDYYFAEIGEALQLMIPRASRAMPHLTKNDSANDKTHHLSEAQQQIYDNIRKDIGDGLRRFCLFGVTGSGKTEIYIKLIEDTLAAGRGVLFLVPEIVLSQQTLTRLKSCFGDNCAILHSNLTTATRFNESLKVFDGKAMIAVGPRSSIFAPVHNLGLIIMDEEHESAYKADESPRFHSRTVAQYLAKTHDAVLLLGSATPSIETYYYATHDIFRLYCLNERYGNAQLPKIEIIDTAQFDYQTNLTLPLVQEINRRLLAHQQIVLLQNRRGFSNVIKCNNCDMTLTCPNCNIYLTYHKADNKLTCHHCGYTIPMPTECPECHSPRLTRLGAGTERIEEEISRTFPHAHIQRMDLDTLKDPEKIQNIFQEIENGQIDILVGTQIIAKGLHFPNIKFVGIINADMMLNIPDFKSSERAFALITQVAGRAGRTDDQGFVMIQTANPTHYSITSAQNSDYNVFYQQEIGFRHLLSLPPFVRMLRLVLRGPKEEEVAANINQICDIIKQHNCDNEKKIEIMGPSPCQIEKINKNMRYQILLKSQSMTAMQTLLHNAIAEIKVKGKNYLEIDVDPVDLF